MKLKLVLTLNNIINDWDHFWMLPSTQDRHRLLWPAWKVLFWNRFGWYLKDRQRLSGLNGIRSRYTNSDYPALDMICRYILVYMSNSGHEHTYFYRNAMHG